MRHRSANWLIWKRSRSADRGDSPAAWEVDGEAAVARASRMLSLYASPKAAFAKAALLAAPLLLLATGLLLEPTKVDTLEVLRPSLKPGTSGPGTLLCDGAKLEAY